MRIAVIGRTHWLLDAAEALAAAGAEIALVATASAPPEYRAGADDFVALADRLGAPFYRDLNLNGAEGLRLLRGADAQLAVSINWPSLIDQAAISAFPRGILNAHAGDLPRYRGNACPNWAILNAEPHVGCCIHAMDPHGVDAGPVYVRRRMPLSDQTYIADIYDWLDSQIPQMFVAAVAGAENSAYLPEAQTGRPLRTHPRRPEDGLIDWTVSADAVSRLIRASSRPFAGAFAYVDGGARVTVWRASPAVLDYDLVAVPGQICGRGPSGGVMVACGEGALEIEEAELEGGGALFAANTRRLTTVRRV